jgi:hypothetical protein
MHSGSVKPGGAAKSAAYGLAMKHVTYAEKSLLVGDEMADALLQYAAQLACDGHADAVDVRAISGDGDEVMATFLVGGGAPLMAETSTTSLPEPDNVELVSRIRAEIARRRQPPGIEPEDAATFVPIDLSGWDTHA